MNRTEILAPLVLCVALSSCGSQSALEAEINDFQHEATPEQWFEMARQSKELGNLSEAVYSYQAVLATEPENLQALAGLAKTYTALRQYDKSIQQWDRLLQLSPEDSAAKIAKAKLLTRFGNLESAAELLNEASIQNPDNWRIWDTLGVISDLKGDYEQAAQYYHRALGINSSESEIYNNLGYSYIMSQSYQQAVVTLGKGLRLAPKSKHIRSNLAIAQAWNGDYKDALVTSNTLMSEAESYNNIGYIAMMREDFETAEDYFQQAIDMSPTFYHKAFVNLEKLRTRRAEISKQ